MAETQMAKTGCPGQSPLISVQSLLKYASELETAKNH